MRRKRLLAGMISLGLLIAHPLSVQAVVSAPAAKEIVIVLDPGHDDKHGGSEVKYGGILYQEQTLNLKIARYCKQELEEYPGVKVYLTRTDEHCPVNGQANAQCLAYRTDKAAALGADFFIALHLNADEKGTAYGAEVLYQNANYASVTANPRNQTGKNLSVTSHALADSILQSLYKIGLTNRGSYYRNATSTSYPDGSMADHFSVIRGSKLAGIPGMIVENAYMTSGSDMSRFLTLESGLKKIGVADATGIANYLGLTRSKPAEPILAVNGIRVDSTGRATLYRNDKPRTDYTGFYTEDNVTWYLKAGVSNPAQSGLLKLEGDWYYLTGGHLDKDYAGLAKNSYGWWFVRNGKLDRSYTGMARNQYGWWYATNGKLDTTFTGMAKNEYGWWYLTNGKVDYSYTGMAKNYYGWWYITNGKLDRTYTGMAKNQYGWWYITDGHYDSTYTGMAKNQYGWWYFNNGKLDRKFTGVARNQYGYWYMKDGRVAFSYNGVITYNGVRYNVVNGKASVI